MSWCKQGLRFNFNRKDNINGWINSLVLTTSIMFIDMVTGRKVNVDKRNYQIILFFSSITCYQVVGAQLTILLQFVSIHMFWSAVAQW